MTEKRVIVVGGGVIGVCCAYFLARLGARVTVVERGAVLTFGLGGRYLAAAQRRQVIDPEHRPDAAGIKPRGEEGARVGRVRLVGVDE